MCVGGVEENEGKEKVGWKKKSYGVLDNLGAFHLWATVWRETRRFTYVTQEP